MADRPCEVPLIEQLRRVPADARFEYEHGPTHHEVIPAGSLCKRAADEIDRLQASFVQASEACRDADAARVKAETELARAKRLWVYYDGGDGKPPSLMTQASVNAMIASLDSVQRYRAKAETELSVIRTRVREYWDSMAALEAAEKVWPRDWSVTPPTRKKAQVTSEALDRFRAAEAALRATPGPFVIAVTGGRDAPASRLSEITDALRQLSPSLVIHGGAQGVDSLVEEAAYLLGIPTRILPADWDKHGRAAGPIRNQAMIDMKPSVLLAFPGGRGTADCVRRARAAGVMVLEYEWRENHG